jgi:SNF2 family DNA or RNA helicase
MSGLPFWLNANDPGTGKTYEALASLERPRDVLVMCPNGVKSVWQDHIRDMYPKATVQVLGGPHKTIDNAADFVIVNWESLSRIPELAEWQWLYVIADEAHAIKNKKTNRARAIKKLTAEHRIALTGTPIINNPAELWSILNWLDKKTWSGYWKFFHRYVDSYQVPPAGYYKIIGSKNEDELWERIAPFTTRRLKRDVLEELPDKYYTFPVIPLHPKQRKAYEQMKKDSLAWLEQLPNDVELPAPTVLAQLIRLRQFASAYCMTYDIYPPNAPDDEYTQTKVRMTEPSSKLDALDEIVENLAAPVVVFSQFRQLIDLAAERLGRYHRVVKMTGQTPQHARGALIEGFQRGKWDVFLTTIQAGGVGITLHRASTCVFLDRAWSPADNSQAEDRLHRIGQKSAVHIISLQAENTVDQAIESRLEWKRDMIRKILDS